MLSSYYEDFPCIFAFKQLIFICLRVVIFELILFRVYKLFAFINLCILIIGKFWPLFLQTVSPPVFSSSFSRIPVTKILEVLIFSYRSLGLCLYFWILFSLFFRQDDFTHPLSLLTLSSVLKVLLLSHPVNFKFQIFFITIIFTWLFF